MCLAVISSGEFLKHVKSSCLSKALKSQKHPKSITPFKPTQCDSMHQTIV